MRRKQRRVGFGEDAADEEGNSVSCPVLSLYFLTFYVLEELNLIFYGTIKGS